MFRAKDAFIYAPVESNLHFNNKHCHGTINTWETWKPRGKQSETESIDDREMSTLVL